MPIQRKLILCVCWSLIVAAPHLLAQSTAEPEPFRVLSVRPTTSDPGTQITLSISRQVTPKAEVFFGRIAGDVISVRGRQITVRVPPDLPPGARPMLTVRDGNAESAANYDFEVSPLRILSITPDTALPGDTVMIVPSSAGKELVSASTGVPRITFGGALAPIERVTKEGVLVQVPVELSPGAQPEVVLSLGNLTSEPFREFKVREGVLDLIEKYFIIMIFVGVGTVYSLVTLYNVVKRRRETRDQPDGEADTNLIVDENLDLSELTVPDDLVEACATDECVLYAGAGLSARCGLPLWKPFVTDLLAWAVENTLFEQKEAKSLLRSLQRGSVDSVADTIVSAAIDHRRQEELNEFLHTKFIEPSAKPSKVHRTLSRVGFSAALTTNFDDLLERTFNVHTDQVRTPLDAEQLLDTLSQGQFFVLKLYGTLERPDTLLVAPAQYEAAISGQRLFADFMNKLFFSRTMLFLGSSLDGLETYLKGVRFQSAGTRQHFAVVPVTEAGWEAKASVLGRRFGITVLPYAASSEYPEIANFVNDLAERAQDRKKQLANTDNDQGDENIVKIALKNIGPFEDIEIDFDEKLTILLGDNGVGKSTILKALAVAIAGEEAEPMARRLIRSGAHGSVEIIVTTSHGKKYLTEIFPRSASVEIKSTPRRLFDLGGREDTLVLGFPPLRTVSWRDPVSPKLIEGRERPTPQDVLPIITPDPDPRIADLKQWLVDIDYRITKGVDVHRNRRLVDDFFETLGELLEGMNIVFKGIDPVQKQIIVRTDDGDVPLDSLSQGTVSVIGWIGVLLQRLFEVHGDAEEPRSKHALVLMDELDAHMHPEWQQVLITKLKHIFPNIQLIVTTHSPFIVGGRRAGEIVRLRRDEDTREILVEHPKVGTRGMGVAAILTSYLFGLRTFLDPETQSRVLRRRELTAQETLTKVEQNELQELNVKIEGSDFAATDDDPLYTQYLKTIVKLEREDRVSLHPQTEEEQQEQAEVTEKIIRELRAQQEQQP